MFSNNLSARNFNHHQKPERVLSRGLADYEPRCAETVKSQGAHEKETDLINLQDDISISPRANNSKHAQIDDLQMKELEEFLSTSGTGNLHNTLEQEKQCHIFFDKYEYKEKIGKFANDVKMLYNDPSSSDLNLNNRYMGTPKVLIPKLDRSEEPNEDLIDEVLLEKNLEKQHLRNAMQYNFIGDVSNHNESKYLSPSIVSKNDCVENSGMMDKIVSSNEIPFTTSKVDYSEQHLHIRIEDLVSKYDIKYLEPVKLDKNTFSKQNVLKIEAEKKHFTVGPSLIAKSVALPNIMKRLADNKKSFDENINNLLVLDTGSQKTIEDNARLSQKPIIQSCDLAENTHFQNRQIQSDKPSASLIVTSKTNKTIEMFGTDSKNNQSVSEKNNGIYEYSRFKQIDELKALVREKLSSDIHDPKRVGLHILHPPQPLMTDCNKNRFVANATSQLVRDFILKSNT